MTGQASEPESDESNHSQEFGGRGDRRIPVTLACSDCKARNYKTTRAAEFDGKALELKKYCKVCKRHTLHRETK